MSVAVAAAQDGGQKKKKDDRQTLGLVKNHFAGTDPELLELVVEVAHKALNGLARGELKRYFEVAEAVTRAVKEQRGGAWHTLVGKSYGSFVTHEDGNMVYISVGPVLIMTFKHG